MTPDTVLTAVTAVFPVTRDEVIGPGRERHQSDARHVVCHLLRAHLRMSNPAIGRLLGNRAHSTAKHGMKAFVSLYATDRQYRAMADRVADILGITFDMTATTTT